jgi:hypothetical protein
MNVQSQVLWLVTNSPCWFSGDLGVLATQLLSGQVKLAARRMMFNAVHSQKRTQNPSLGVFQSGQAEQVWNDSMHL